MGCKSWLSLMLALVTNQHLPVANGWSLVDYNMSEYHQMPPLFQYESIDKCLRSDPEGAFCIVKSVVKPDENSPLWRSIQKYSKYAYQYQHDVLTRGVCVEACRKLVENLRDQQRFWQPEFDVEFKYIINDWLLPNIEQFRSQYSELLNICQNYRMQSEYNLTVFSEIEHCTTNATSSRDLDFWDVLYYTLIVLLFILAVASSVYDAKLATDHNHYRTPLGSKTDSVLTCFSLRRNLNRLTIKLQTNALQQDLRFLDAIRVLTMTTITMSHVGIGVGMTTSQNPEVFERMSAMPGVQMFLSLVPFQVDIFFAISGLLLAVHFVKYTEGKRFSVGHFWMAVVNRFLRSLPLYALVMLFSVSVYDQLQVSPSAYKIMPMVRTICRDKWWINALFLNNYYRPEEQCLIHTWYLAADFQLFIFGMAIVMILWRYPNLMKPIFYILLVLGMALPMLNIYFYSMDAVMLITNKGNAFQLWYDRWFTLSYQATETHCLSYFGGMLVGFMYHEMQKNDLLLAKSKLYKTLQYFVFPALVAFCLPAPLFHQYNFAKPSLWMSFYAGVHRLVVTSFLVVGFLLLMFAERDSFFGRLRSSKLLENAFYRVLGRLSFGFYLIHMSVMKIVYGNQHEAQRISFPLVIVVFTSVTLITYVLALVAYIFVEKPFDIIFKHLLGGGSSGKRPQAREGATNHVVTLDNNLNRVDSKL
ncbi:nose resistant to fluoxetine protein 6-like [Culex pipiens pallens]|uniref:nose resistant to fluoxetine protein 6-like n=1 Tax=Culex pipiens pallens TaxID=42434 RepID=UPI001953C248|nr:nose resistant to fluoxetine protein 6-like [Culex pipiens pallens]